MPYALLLLLLVFIQSNTNSQNLVLDPGFEKVRLVYDGTDTVYIYDHWTSLMGFRKTSVWGRPLYSEYISKVADPEEQNKYWMPYEGNSFLMSHIQYFRNLYQTKLIHPLIPDSTYKVNFKYRVLADDFSKERVEKAINHKIGFWLTTKDMSDTSTMRIIKNEGIKLHPNATVDNFNGDSIFTWQDFTYFFKADKPYSHIIIGNFEKIIESYELKYHPIAGVSYRIDMVTIEPYIGIKNPVPPVALHNVNMSRTLKEIHFEGIMNDSVLLYYSKVHEAEKYIIKDSLQLALANYIKAFSYKKPFFRDYSNARKVFSLQSSADTSIQQFLDEQRPLVLYSNKRISNQIDSLFKLDQEARTHGKDIKMTDASNYVFVKNMLAQHSISDYEMGFNAATQLQTLLLHLSRYENFDSMLYILYAAVRNGDFDNRTFAGLADSYYEHHVTFDKMKTHYATQSIWPLYTKFIIPELSEEESALINDKRKAIGLEKLELQYVRQFYNFRNGYKDYEFYQFFTYFPYDGTNENQEYLCSENQKLDEILSKSGKWIIWNK